MLFVFILYLLSTVGISFSFYVYKNVRLSGISIIVLYIPINYSFCNQKNSLEAGMLVLYPLLSTIIPRYLLAKRYFCNKVHVQNLELSWLRSLMQYSH